MQKPARPVASRIPISVPFHRRIVQMVGNKSKDSIKHKRCICFLENNDNVHACKIKFSFEMLGRKFSRTLLHTLYSIQGAQFNNTEATDTCNMAITGEFYELSEFVRF